MRHYGPSPKPAGLAFGHPAAQALARSELASMMRTLRIDLYQLQAGEDARKTLARLALMLGLGAEVAAQIGIQPADARRLHSTLRTAIGMAVAGCRWAPQHAPVFDDAAKLAHHLIRCHEPLAGRCLPGGMALRAAVEDGSIRLTDVAGAEIYSTTPTGATT